LLSFDITAQAFVPRNSGYEGELVENVQELTLEHPQIARRKDFLKVGPPITHPLFLNLDNRIEDEDEDVE
jgi:hypothetical protein